MTKTIDALVEALTLIRGKHGCGALTLPVADLDRVDAALAQARAEQAGPVQAATAWMYTSKLAGHQVFLTRYASDLTTYKADKVTPLFTTPPAAPVAKLEPLDAMLVIDGIVKSKCSLGGGEFPDVAFVKGVRFAEAAHNAKLGGAG